MTDATKTPVTQHEYAVKLTGTGENPIQVLCLRTGPDEMVPIAHSVNGGPWTPLFGREEEFQAFHRQVLATEMAPLPTIHPREEALDAARANVGRALAGLTRAESLLILGETVQQIAAGAVRQERRSAEAFAGYEAFRAQLGAKSTP